MGRSFVCGQGRSFRAGKQLYPLIIHFLEDVQGCRNITVIKIINSKKCETGSKQRPRIGMTQSYIGFKSMRGWSGNLALTVLVCCISYGLIFTTYRAVWCVSAFGEVLRTQDRTQLSELSRLQDQARVMEYAELIWQLTFEDKTSSVTQRRSVHVEWLPFSFVEWLVGNRDLLVVTGDEKTKRRMRIFYYRLRWGYLMAGADPKKFQELEKIGSERMIEQEENDR